MVGLHRQCKGWTTDSVVLSQPQGLALGAERRLGWVSQWCFVLVDTDEKRGAVQGNFWSRLVFCCFP